MLTASSGKHFSALMIFAHSLKYFRDHALAELSDQSGTKILNEDVRWVITVPAIWKAPAKQFMRQAAYEVGPDDVLVILLIGCRIIRWNSRSLLEKIKLGRL